MLSFWDPFAEMSHMQERFMNRSLNGNSSWKPAVDIYEDESGIHVSADVAGIKPEDIKVNVERNILTISGERRLENEDTREGYHRVERSYGSFTRSFALTDEIDTEKIDARYDNGVLSLRLNKRPAAKRREIEVKAA